MAGVSAIDLMTLSIDIERKKLEATTTNLANINQSFNSKLAAEGVQQVEVNDFPTITQVIAGDVNVAPTPRIAVDPNEVERVLQYEGDTPTIKYKAKLNLEEEMVKLSEATRAYEASIRLFNINKEMSGRVIRIGSKG